jgi:hypothetical protein
VIVIGPGRSGTSTVAGALAKSGLEVPGRAIKGNPTNPSGFFEPRWVVDLHRELLDRAHVGTMDASPAALAEAAKVAGSPDVRGRLRDWLRERLEEQPRLVVKDPRTIWFSDLWVETARELGVEPGFVTMLRHPAEVSASRQKYYSKSERAAAREAEINRIAGWVNVALTAEQVSRGSRRSFIRYTDLVADWRGALGRIGDALDVPFEPTLDTSPHPVDEFIDPTLHRVRVDWADVDVPAHLQEVGERAWQALGTLADAGESEETARRVDEVREDYAQLASDARALCRTEIRRAEVTARQRGRRQLRRELAAARPAGLAQRIRNRLGRAGA